VFMSPVSLASAARPIPGQAVRSTPVTRIKALGTITIRSGPGLRFARTGALGTGDVRTVTGASNDYNWWYISCTDGTGWVSADPDLTRPVAWR